MHNEIEEKKSCMKKKKTLKLGSREYRDSLISHAASIYMHAKEIKEEDIKEEQSANEQDQF